MKTGTETELAVIAEVSDAELDTLSTAELDKLIDKRIEVKKGLFTKHRKPLLTGNVEK